MSIDLRQMESSTKFLPPKLQTVANSIREGIPILEKGGRLRFARKVVQRSLGCGQYVSDDEILGILQDKLTILERENIFDSNKFVSKYEKDFQTVDGDRIIYVEYRKTSKEDQKMDSLSDDEVMKADNKEKDDKDAYVVIPGTKTKIKNDKFTAKIKEKEETEETENKENDT